jgi:hypothetical protein
MDLDGLVHEDGAVRLIDSSFPVDVSRSDAATLDDLETSECRIALAVAPGEQGFFLCVWTKGTGDGPQLVLLEEVASIESMAPTGRTLKLTDGRTVQYTPSRHCGCGSRLRAFSGWKGRRVIAVRKPKLPWLSGSPAA